MLTHNENSSYKKDVELLEEIVKDLKWRFDKKFFLENIQVLERIIHNFEQHQCNEVDLLIGETQRRRDVTSSL